MAKPEQAIPAPKKREATVPEIRGPYFSTKWPNKAAERPRNRIAMLKVSCVSPKFHPVCLTIGLMKTLQEYTEPMEM